MRPAGRLVRVTEELAKIGVEQMYRAVVIVLAAFLVPASADARSRAARPLEIRSADGNVLGCLPSDEGEAVEIDAAGVSSITVDGRDLGKSWSIVLEDGLPPHRLEPRDCLAYGHLPGGYWEVAAPAELESEWPYSFGIRSPQWGKHGTRNHTVSFCVRRSSGGIVAIAVPEGPAAITVETCRRLLDGASPGGGSTAR